MTQKLSVFKGKKIRKTIYKDEWWFSVVDVCGALTDSVDTGAYWRKLKQRLIEEGSEVLTNCHGLKLMASDGKKYETDCANTKGTDNIEELSPSEKMKILCGKKHFEQFEGISFKAPVVKLEEIVL